MKKHIALALTLSFAAIAGCAQAGPADGLNQKEVETIVKNYLLENPEVIREALIVLEEREEQAMREAVLTSVSDSLFKDSRDVSVGPDDAKVTIVEFFDYNCGFCKRSTEWVKSTLEKYPDDVRVVFKELPILDGRTKTSRNAAKAALAAHKQGLYLDMHFALMKARSLTPERVETLASDMGVNVETLKADMEDPALETYLSDTLALANQIPPLTGTPFFVINDEFIAGANTDRLQEILETALKS